MEAALERPALSVRPFKRDLGTRGIAGTEVTVPPYLVHDGTGTAAAPSTFAFEPEPGATNMTTIEAIMTREVTTLEPEMSLREAGERLAADGLSGAPVVSGTRLVGVVSITDLVDFQASSPGVPARRDDQQEWGEFETTDGWDEELNDPPSGYFVGLWAESAGDVRKRFEVTEGPEWDFWAEHTVGEVMTRKVVALGPEASVKDAAELMVKRGVHRGLVLRDGDVAGIVTSTDVVRAVADGTLS